MKRGLSSLLAAVVLWFSVSDVAFAAKDLRVVSFNVQFLGLSEKRRNNDLADMLAPYDLVLVQEVVAPPYPGTFPDGSPRNPDEQVTAFFDAMKARGFDFVLSEEDTGPGPKNHSNASATEWFVAFYKPARVKPAPRLPHGFLSSDLTQNPDFDRVPYAFAFEAGKADLVFISVHLRPDSGPANRARRAHELGAIFSWISANAGSERDYVVLGDMNLQNCGELHDVLPEHHASLNGECQATNTNVNSPKPFDQVMYQTEDSAREIDVSRGLTVINLVEEMRLRWPANLGQFPGEPYHHDAFRALYSDHDPILFEVRTSGPDDD